MARGAQISIIDKLIASPSSHCGWTAWKLPHLPYVPLCVTGACYVALSLEFLLIKLYLTLGLKILTIFDWWAWWWLCSDSDSNKQLCNTKMVENESNKRPTKGIPVIMCDMKSGLRYWIFDVCLANEDWAKFTDLFISCFHVASLFIRQIWSQFVMNMSLWNKSCSQHIKRHLAYLLVFLLAHLLKGLGIQIATNTTLADYWHTFQSRYCWNIKSRI